jgi:hypothetical protein
MQPSRKNTVDVAVAALVLLCAALAGCNDTPTEPATVGPTDVAVAYCTGLEPAWVAFQDGDGQWTRVRPTIEGANTVFHLALHTARGGIATLVPLADGTLTQLSVLYGLPGELATVGDTNRLDCTFDVKTVVGRVVGLRVDESALVSAGLFGRAIVHAQNDSFTLVGLASGSRDLVVTRTTPVAGIPTVTGIILRRNVDVPDGGSIPPLDFASPEVFAPATSTVTIAGLGADAAISGTHLRTSNGETTLSFVPNQGAAPSRSYFPVPESRLLPGDLQELSVATSGPNTFNRRFDLYFRTPGDRTVALGASAVAPAISVISTSPALRVRARFVPQGDYDRSASIFFDQVANSVFVGVVMTAGYAAATGGGYDLVVPDLSAAEGFSPTWALRPGLRFTWSANRVGGTLGLGRDAPLADGLVRRSAFLQDTLTLR